MWCDINIFFTESAMMTADNEQMKATKNPTAVKIRMTAQDCGDKFISCARQIIRADGVTVRKTRRAHA